MAKKVATKKEKKKRKVKYYRQIYGKSKGRKLKLLKLGKKEVRLKDVKSGLRYGVSRTNFEKFFSKILTKKEVKKRNKEQEALGLKPLPKSFKKLKPNTFEWMRYWRTFPEKQPQMILWMKEHEKERQEKENEKIALFKKKAKAEERKKKKKKKSKKKKKKKKEE